MKSNQFFSFFFECTNFFLEKGTKFRAGWFVSRPGTYYIDSPYLIVLFIISKHVSMLLVSIDYIENKHDIENA
jgi:hypothetical protein